MDMILTMGLGEVTMHMAGLMAIAGAYLIKGNLKKKE